MTDLTPIFEAIIGLIAIAVTAILIPYIKSKLTNSQFEKLCTIVRMAVLSAEEAARSGLILKYEKYDYAVGYLAGYGYTFDEEKTKQLINSAVYEMINQFKEV